MEKSCGGKSCGFNNRHRRIFIIAERRYRGHYFGKRKFQGLQIPVASFYRYTPGSRNHSQKIQPPAHIRRQSLTRWNYLGREKSDRRKFLRRIIPPQIPLRQNSFGANDWLPLAGRHEKERIQNIERWFKRTHIQYQKKQWAFISLLREKRPLPHDRLQRLRYDGRLHQLLFAHGSLRQNQPERPFGRAGQKRKRSYRILQKQKCFCLPPLRRKAERRRALQTLPWLETLAPRHRSGECNQWNLHTLSWNKTFRNG